MLFLGASKGNYFQWTLEHDVVMRSPDRDKYGRTLQQH